MGRSYNEMNLDVGSTYVPKTIAQILREVSMADDIAKKASMLEFHIHEMENEISKIEYFKRQLPQCMHLLEDAIEVLKLETSRWKGREKGPVMVEFLQSKAGCGMVNGSFDISEKKRWMESVNLWSTPVRFEENFDTPNQQDSVLIQKSNHKREEGDDGETASIHLNGYRKPHKKKQRRCWSPELHKRFVDALHRLGGEQAATPKQIKELMKVDGLTNDQVKSHLQKYRLHIRKLSTWYGEPLSAGSWLTQDQCGGAQSGSPQGPLQHGELDTGS